MSDLAEQMVTAAIDGGDLWPHNADTLNHPQIEQAVLRALDTRAVTASEFDYGMVPHPRLVMCDPDVVAYSLIEVLATELLPYMHEPCDRCLRQVQPGARLWVAAGGSVVELHCCLDCATELQHDYPNIVWR